MESLALLKSYIKSLALFNSRREVKRWLFSKYVGAGNDFIIFNNCDGSFPVRPNLIQHLCQRQKGIGADGLLLLQSSTLDTYCLRIFNSDGSEAEMCGNGVRCFVKWLANQGMQSSLYKIQILQQTLTARQIGHTICLEMPLPKDMQWDTLIPFEDQYLRTHYLNTGVPHAVLFVKDIENVNLKKLGSYIRNYPLWMPMGANVTVAQKKKNQHLTIRTYERGVEGETLACGTGATAAALAAVHEWGFLSPVIIETRAREELKIEFSFENQQFSNIKLIGGAECIFVGEIDLPEIHSF